VNPVTDAAENRIREAMAHGDPKKLLGQSGEIQNDIWTLAMAYLSSGQSRSQVKELAAMVQNMRSAQANYFKSRTPEALNHSKLLERELDAKCKAILAATAGKPSTPTLFDTGGEG
jgi:hypothetical protein